MNVLHINQSDIDGGAAIAGYRLHEGLLQQGISSRLLVGTVTLNDSHVSATPRKTRIENQLNRITRRLGLNYINLVSSFDIPRHSFYQEADVLNFHNLHSGYFNYLAIPTVTNAKPTIFTLHDMWSFTGHCAYSYSCDRWKMGCGQCPDLGSYPAIPKDTTKLEWKLKNWIYNQANMVIVAPSQWLTAQAKQSILKRFPIHHIPYGLDTDAYQPIDIAQCRGVLGIPMGKKVVMCGAASLQQSRKGGDLLVRAFEHLPRSLKDNMVLLALGQGGETIAKSIDVQTIELGYVTSDRLKSIAYSASDTFVFPTRADNLPLVLQESLACGTPIVSFDVGGVPDLVRHGITGYVAKPENIQDLANGIAQLLEDDSLRSYMSQQCREIAVGEYSLNIQARKYIELYESLTV